MAKDSTGKTIDDYLDDSMSDPLSEQIYDLVDTSPSKTAFRLGKFLLKRGVALPAVKIVVEGFDEKYFTGKRQRDRAAQIIRQWVRYACDDLSDISVARTHMGSLLNGLTGLSHHYSLFRKVMDLISENAQTPTIALCSDIENLGKHGDGYSSLPYSIREIFLDSVDSAMAYNRRYPMEERRRYNHLGDIVSSLSGFKDDHNPALHEVVRMISQRDTRYILYPLYEELAALPSDVPDIVVYSLARAVEFIPKDRAMIDTEVQEFSGFLNTLSVAFQNHTPQEIDCFFDLYRRLIRNTETWRVFKDMKYMLDVSISVRRGKRKAEDLDLDAKMERLRFLGLKYLLVSYDIMGEDGEDIDHFADRVLAMNREGMQEASDLVQLYERVMLDSDFVGIDAADRFGSMIKRAKRAEEMQAEIERNRVETLKKGPVPCPEHLKRHIYDTFGNILDGDVEHIWDLRSNQEFLYMSQGSAKTFIELTRLKTDPSFLDKIVRKLEGSGLLDREITLVGGGCGPASAEIEFYKALNQHGYDVELILVDKSPEMIDEAEANCIAEGIEARIMHKKLEDLSVEHVALGRQVCLAFFGGTWFNISHARALAEHYYRMFEGLHVLDSFGQYAHEPGNHPLMLIEGDTKKNKSYYENRLSRLFLARGLGSNYHLPMEALMHDGRLCHTTYYNDGDSVLQSLYLVTKNSGPFRKNHVIWVIDSNTMHPEVFSRLMGYSNFSTDFIRGPDHRAAAVCTPMIKRLK